MDRRCRGGLGKFSARISALYAANTADAVTGALLTGFVLIGALGMQRTFLITWSDVPLVEGLRPLQRVSLGLRLPSLLLGVSFSALLKLGVPASQAGGFLLMPTMGARLSIVVLAGVFVVTGLALRALHPGRARMAALAVTSLAAFGLLAPTIRPLARH